MYMVLRAGSLENSPSSDCCSLDWTVYRTERCAREYRLTAENMAEGLTRKKQVRGGHRTSATRVISQADEAIRSGLEPSPVDSTWRR